MQRVALAKRCFADPGPRFLLVARNRDPGSAAHHAVKNGALRCVRGTKIHESRRSRNCECIPIPAPEACLILFASCPVRGASRGDPEVGQSESWLEWGNPDWSMRRPRLCFANADSGGLG